MTISHFRKCNFTKMINNLGPHIDLNNVIIIMNNTHGIIIITTLFFQTRDCFSYKHFYVLYCKFWVLDEDHDLIISESDLLNYNDGLLSPQITKQIMQHGRIPAFARENQPPHASIMTDKTLTYLDYICMQTYIAAITMVF